MYLVHAFNGKEYILEDDKEVSKLLNKEVSKLLRPLPIRRIVELRLLKVDPVWTRYEKELMDDINLGEETVFIDDDNRSDVFIWILKNKENMTRIVTTNIQHSVLRRRLQIE